MAKRLFKEAQDLAKEQLDWASAEPVDDNLNLWNACIMGPSGSPYEGGLFNLELNIPESYPYKPPVVKFKTKIYHPSIKQDTGEICDEIISGGWKPTLNIKWVLTVLKQLLEHPESETPLEAEIGQLLQSNKEEFKRKAQEETQKYAM